MPELSSDSSGGSDGVIGSPDAPAFTPRPIRFALSLVLFAIWMAILLYWAVQLRTRGG